MAKIYDFEIGKEIFENKKTMAEIADTISTNNIDDMLIKLEAIGELLDDIGNLRLNMIN